ncbi:hypothetical protein [Metabacillus fastidiosus]|uniref:hypothetical protein n=1 Tax=Metabacillus fastidiosus TaxID=1458 RepID=UPI003D2A035E
MQKKNMITFKRRITLRKLKLFNLTLLFTLIVMSFSTFILQGTSSAATSYLMDTKKEYTYSIYNENKKDSKEYVTATFIGKKNEGNLWFFKGKNYILHELYLQDEESLKVGDPFEDGILYKELVFPLIEGKKWDAGDGETYKIVSLSNTVKTPAGTFSTVEVDYDNKTATSYYAPGVGLVKYRDIEGNVMELVKSKDLHYGRVLIKQQGVKLYTPKGTVQRALKKGEGLKIFKEDATSYDVGAGYYVKKSKETLFYTGFIYSPEQTMDIFAPNSTVHRKARIGETIRVYGFKDGNFLVGGGYYIPADYHIRFDR